MTNPSSISPPISCARCWLTWLSNRTPPTGAKAWLPRCGRVTMLGISPWSGTGGSYRSVQRFFYINIPWAKVFWYFFQRHLLDKQDTYILAGDECVVTRSGKKTYGLDYFFSGLLKKAVPSLSFFTLALVSVKQQRSYPLRMEQTGRSAEEKANSQIKKLARKAKSEEPKRKRGRPKGSCNKKVSAQAKNLGRK